VHICAHNSEKKFKHIKSFNSHIDRERERFVLVYPCKFRILNSEKVNKGHVDFHFSQRENSKLKNVFFSHCFFENTKIFSLIFIFNHLDKMNGVSKN
jgi:hypothetical protein